MKFSMTDACLRLFLWWAIFNQTTQTFGRIDKGKINIKKCWLPDFIKTNHALKPRHHNCTQGDFLPSSEK